MMKASFVTVFVVSVFCGIQFLQKEREMIQARREIQSLELVVRGFRETYPEVIPFVEKGRGRALSSQRIPLNDRNVEQAKSAFQELFLQRIEEGNNDNAGELFRDLSNLLEPLANLTNAEAVEIIIKTIGSDDYTEKREALRYMLAFVAVEIDPLLLLKKGEENGFFSTSSIKRGAIASLVRQDLSSAMVWLGEYKAQVSSEDYPLSHVKSMVASRLFSEDPEEGLKYFHELGLDHMSPTYVDIDSSEKRREMARALGESQAKGIRYLLAKVLLVDARKSGDLKSLISLSEVMFPEEDKKMRNHAFYGSAVLFKARTIEEANATLEFVQSDLSEFTDRVVESLVNEWASDDFNSTGDWLNQLPDSDAKDVGVEKFADLIFQVDPETAMTWAKALSDPLKVEQSRKGLFKRWLEEYPEEAKAWAKENDFAE